MKPLTLLLLSGCLLVLSPDSGAQQVPQPGRAPQGHRAPGETHAHRSPHGGIVRTAGTNHAYHVELLVQPTQVQVFLLNRDMEPVLSERTSGSVVLHTRTGKSLQLPLTATGGGGFAAALPAGTSMRTAVVYLKTNGRSLSARYEKLEVLKVGANTLAYHCPMACADSPSAKPGTCPKCGMKLEKQS
ncbi:heavy metal-binding domain-containing protein [Solirubrum puertoriconensis]|uniref:Heavy metal binding domain-containing protein n=1 Tax=Solirubrum puertoriconensis TaxID=1751427 RepID=A0A9X0L5V5_SOLP1|nr:heavy metal-binding domain-containing protein [Solirubrum puertoriconensis]KUG09095.1 hypothetical protein ASU33_19950 [Solirubrum puertoriconensis]